MGYSSMIMDESAPNEVLASRELSPIRYGTEKSSSSDSESRDEIKEEEEEGGEVGGQAEESTKRQENVDVDLMKHGQPLLHPICTQFNPRRKQKKT